MAVVCTKLVQWLSFGGLFMAVWAALLAELLPIRLTPQLYEVILPLPVYCLICFGCYSLALIGYRLMIFNDCESASEELKNEIEQARKDLTSKGMKL